MFKILQKTFTTGIATVAYPSVPAVISSHFRGAPEFDFASWRDARPAAEVCPTGAIVLGQAGPEGTPPDNRRVTIDYGLCVFCGQGADVTPEGAGRGAPEVELA